MCPKQISGTSLRAAVVLTDARLQGIESAILRMAKIESSIAPKRLLHNEPES
jgi:hypothetical protein